MRRSGRGTDGACSKIINGGPIFGGLFIICADRVRGIGVACSKIINGGPIFEGLFIICVGRGRGNGGGCSKIINEDRFFGGPFIIRPLVTVSPRPPVSVLRNHTKPEKIV